MRRLLLTLLLLWLAAGAVNAAALGASTALAEAAPARHCPGHGSREADKHGPAHCVSCSACIPAINAAAPVFITPALRAVLNPHPEIAYASLTAPQLQRPPSFF